MGIFFAGAYSQAIARLHPIERNVTFRGHRAKCAGFRAEIEQGAGWRLQCGCGREVLALGRGERESRWLRPLSKYTGGEPFMPPSSTPPNEAENISGKKWQPG